MLVGALIDQGARLQCFGHAGRCTFVVSEGEREHLLALVAMLDGRTERQQLVGSGMQSGQVDGVLDALTQVRAVVDDVGNLWSWFAEFSANPGIYDPPMTAEAAYALPVVSPLPRRAGQALIDGDASASTHSALFSRDRSLSLDAIDSERTQESSHLAILVGMDAVRQADGHPYYSSAGAMLPVTLAAFVPDHEGEGFALLSFDARAGTVRRDEGFSRDQISACFLQDDQIQRALAGRPCIFVQVADVRRSSAKYGNRAWLYSAIEVGQINHRLELSANLRGLRTRPIGGFCEGPLAHLLSLDGALPMLTTLAAFEV